MICYLFPSAKVLTPTCPEQVMCKTNFHSCRRRALALGTFTAISVGGARTAADPGYGAEAAPPHPRHYGGD
jgi:hypothetical protein